MDQQITQPLEPRMKDGKALVIAGVQGRYSKATAGDIPKLWGVFDDSVKHIKKRVDGVSYGVCHNPSHGEFDYMAGWKCRPKAMCRATSSSSNCLRTTTPCSRTMARCRHWSRPTSASCSSGCRTRATRWPGRISSATARISMYARARGRWRSGCPWNSGNRQAEHVPLWRAGSPRVGLRSGPKTYRCGSPGRMRQR